ncbi:MAG: hypothetical protein ACREUQ_08780, partial [Burkholderiales bacterium]
MRKPQRTSKDSRTGTSRVQEGESLHSPLVLKSSFWIFFALFAPSHREWFSENKKAQQNCALSLSHA